MAYRTGSHSRYELKFTGLDYQPGRLCGSRKLLGEYDALRKAFWGQHL